MHPSRIIPAHRQRAELEAAAAEAKPKLRRPARPKPAAPEALVDQLKDGEP